MVAPSSAVSLRVHAGRRFIEQQESGLGGERTRELDLALIAIGKVRHQIARAVRQVENGQHFPRPVADRRFRAGSRGNAQDGWPEAGPVPHVKTDCDIVDDRQVAEQANVLKGSRHAEAGIVLGAISRHVLAAKDDPAAARLQHAGQQMEGGRLAGTVRSDEAEDLASANREVELRAPARRRNSSSARRPRAAPRGPFAPLLPVIARRESGRVLLL